MRSEPSAQAGGAGEMVLPGQKLAHVYGLLLSLQGFCLSLTAGQIETVDLEAPELTCSEVPKYALPL